MGEMVTFGNLSGYLSDGDGPGVVVIDESWGLAAR